MAADRNAPPPEDPLAERLRSLDRRLARSRSGRVARLALRGARVLIKEGLGGANARIVPLLRRWRAPKIRRTLPRQLAPIAIPAMRDPGGVSIVMTVFNQAGDTYHCLHSIVEHTPAGQYEVIAVDNASTDETPMLLAQVSGLRVLSNGANRGFVDANNQAAAEARGSFLLFLNNDTRVTAGWLQALLDTLAADPAAGAAGAMLIAADGRLQEAGAIVWSDGNAWLYGRGDEPSLPPYQYKRPVDYCSAACLLVRRELFEQLGGFDPRFAPAYYEDVDLCFEIRRLGYDVVYQPRARVVHIEGATAGTDIARGFKRFQEVNRGVFQQKHAGVLEAGQPPPGTSPRRARDRRRGQRILVIDQRVPRPDHDAGSMRTMAILRILGDLGHAVTFLPDDLEAPEPYTGTLQQLGVEVLYGPVSIADYLARNVPEFDIAIVCRATVASKHLAAIVAMPNRPPVVYDTVDLHFLREQRRAEVTGDADATRGAELMKRTELQLARAGDRVWVTSPYEVEVLKQEDDSLRVDVIPLIDTVRTAIPGYDQRRDLVFVGGFLHSPNEDAVLHFVEKILPSIQRRLPAARFLIVGSHPPAAIRALASDSVVVTGFVKDLAALLDATRIMVAPLRYGAGLKGKITHSLANGLPVVTTRVGAEGMLVQDREHLLIADSEPAFAERVVELYEDPQLWTRLSKAGAAHVDAHFGYEAVKKRLDAAVRALAS